MAPQNRPHTTKLFHFQRSAMEPVGMVAVVSMKATMYRKKAEQRRRGVVTDVGPSPCHRNAQLPLPISGVERASARRARSSPGS